MRGFVTALRPIGRAVPAFACAVLLSALIRRQALQPGSAGLQSGWAG